MFSVVFYTHILDEVALVDLPFQLTFMLLSDAQLLVLHVVRCGFHSLFSFDVLLSFLLECGNRLIHLWLNNILLEDLVQTVLILVYFLYVSALCLVSPADVGWRKSADLFPVLVLDLLSCDLLLKELFVLFLEKLLGRLFGESPVLVVSLGGCLVSRQDLLLGQNVLLPLKLLLIVLGLDQRVRLIMKLSLLLKHVFVMVAVLQTPRLQIVPQVLAFLLLR